MLNGFTLNGAPLNGEEEGAAAGAASSGYDATFNGFTFNGAPLNGAVEAGGGDGTLWANATLPALTGFADLYELRFNGELPAMIGAAILYRSATTGQHIGMLPALTGAARFGNQFSGSLPKLTGDATFTHEGSILANATLAKLSGAARVNAERYLSATAALPSLIGEVRFGARFNATLPKLTGTATLTHEGMIRVSGTLPKLSGAATFTAENSIRVNGNLPALQSIYALFNSTLPALTGTVLLSVDEVRQLVAYAMNLSNGSMTRYDGYDFDFVVRYRGAHLGFSAAGAFTLDSDDDAGMQINAFAEIPPSDFGTRTEKRAPYVYVGSEGSEQVNVTATVDEGIQYSAVTSMAGRNKRAKLPRGPKGVYWGFRLSNINGGPLNIDGLDVVPDVVRRKV